jgi:phage gp36-like protein
MTYATLSDLVTRYGSDELAQRTDRIAGNTIDQTVIDRALSDADAEIDSSLAARYTLPVASVPPLLVRVACTIARYHLHDEAATQRIREDYEDALKVLAEIRSGARLLPLAAADGGGTAAADKSTGGVVSTRSPVRIFTSDLMTRFGRF